MENRMKLLRSQLKQLGIDGMLITSSTNRRYITGFTGTAGAVLISMKHAELITDSRYSEQAKNQAIDFEVIQHKDTLLQQIIEDVRKLGITRLGFEKNHLVFDSYQQLTDGLSIETVPVSGVIENLRMVKNDEELEKIRTAAQIADATFAHILEFIAPGLSEKTIRYEMEAFMRKQGADGGAFETIVASGVRSALPHGVASDKLIQKGEMLTLDFGAYYRGYRSDLTRTIAIGEPDSRLKEIYQIVWDAELLTIDRLRPGVSCRDIDDFTHRYIDALGYGPHFEHGTGHGIGLDIHEEPFFSKKSDKVLESGMVVTVEPGIYIPALGGVRIEDDVLITPEGHEVLTASPKHLITL